MTDPAPHRIGKPGPLAFHLNAGLACVVQALLAAPNARSPDFPWSEELRATAASWPDDPDQMALAAEAARRLRAMLDGIRAWQTHPYRRGVKDPPAIWQSGTTRLLDYGHRAGAQTGAPVLVVPSLINRAYVLDLHEDCSLMRFMACRGLRPFLLDWGVPGPREAGYGISDYATARLLPALAYVNGLTGRKAALLGYCMGGTIAAIFACRQPEGLSALATLGAPYAFGHGRGMSGALRKAARNLGAGNAAGILESLASTFGFVPSELFQYLFAALNPVQAFVKFRRFAAMDMAGTEARHFVALEDWLADAVPMSGAAARDILVAWQLEDALAAGNWSFMGAPVDLRDIALPALVVTGQKDHIAPPDTADPLAAAIAGARHLKVASGHVGMIAGHAAPDSVWSPLADFLSRNAD
ncbi:MAG: alpha/beta fold hydrolase [Paracoccaceae bacterium]